VGSPSSSKFSVLGVPATFDLDPEELERRFRERSREVHPDRFARAPVAERVKALAAATELNQAYKVLRSPVRRAEHLLELAGAPLSAKEPVPQEFLLEILELREALDEAKAAADRDQVARLERDMRARFDAAMRRVGELFAAGGAPEEIKRELVNLRYFQRFLDEVEGRDEEAA
jgi:molecular chaperone HscB